MPRHPSIIPVVVPILLAFLLVAPVARAQEGLTFGLPLDQGRITQQGFDPALLNHRQGLLPLTEVLDAEAGLKAARVLLLEGQPDARLDRARLQLAPGEPVEGVKS